MSLGLPKLRPTPDSSLAFDPNQGNYGAKELMAVGLGSSKDGTPGQHHLQYSEEHWQEQRNKMDMVTTRNMQGLHMPLKLQMERQAASQVGRLPCMSTGSSNLLYNTLIGHDDTIDFDAVLNNPTEFPERMGQPHAIMERRLGIL